MAARLISLGQEATLMNGSRGSLVSMLQETLAGAGFSPGKIDGIFGQGTHDAVVRFQNSKGLTPDGIVGPQMWLALKGPATGPLPQPGAMVQAIALSPKPSAPVPAWYQSPMVIYAVAGLALIVLMTGKK